MTTTSMMLGCDDILIATVRLRPFHRADKLIEAGGGTESLVGPTTEQMNISTPRWVRKYRDFFSYLHYDTVDFVVVSSHAAFWLLCSIRFMYLHERRCTTDSLSCSLPRAWGFYDRWNTSYMQFFSASISNFWSDWRCEVTYFWSTITD